MQHVYKMFLILSPACETVFLNANPCINKFPDILIRMMGLGIFSFRNDRPNKRKC